MNSQNESRFVGFSLLTVIAMNLYLMSAGPSITWPDTLIFIVVCVTVVIIGRWRTEMVGRISFRLLVCRSIDLRCVCSLLVFE